MSPTYEHLGDRQLLCTPAPNQSVHEWRNEAVVVDAVSSQYKVNIPDSRQWLLAPPHKLVHTSPAIIRGHILRQ